MHGISVPPQADQIHRINRELLVLEGSGESESGLVRATVGVRHDLRSLDIDPRVYRERDPDLLADDIREAMRLACEEVDRRAYDVAGPLLPDGDHGDPAYEPLLRTLDELVGGNPRESW